MGELYEYIDTWDGKMVFTYIVIFIFVVWFFSKKNIGINILVGILVASFIISYLNHKSMANTDTKQEILNIKKDSIKPKTTKGFKHNDIINFLFSIQDLYRYNPLQYEKMVQHIHNFFELYEISFVEKKRANINYKIMENEKRDSLNSLTSLIFSLPNDIRTKEKINNAAVILDSILTNYLDQIGYISDEYLYKNGYNVDTKIINYGTKPFNEYSDIYKPYSYEIY